MESLIIKTMQLPSVTQVVDRLHLRKDEMWHIYFDSGIQYLECLKDRIKHKWVFDAMFGAMVSTPSFGKLHLIDVFDEIRNSSDFWAWWSVQLWCICKEEDTFRNKTELFYRLQFIDTLIPLFILKRVFNGKQKPKSRQRPSCTSSKKDATASAKTIGIGKRIGNRV